MKELQMDIVQLISATLVFGAVMMIFGDAWIG